MSVDIHNRLLDLANKHCRPLETIILDNGVINIQVPNNLDVFDCLAQTVVEQQLSYKAAKSIWEKINNSAKELDMKLMDYLSEENTISMRNDGLSNNKIKAILGARVAVKSGDITLSKISEMDDETYKKTITSLWGFGDWSAEMIAIFYLGKTNIWSEKDLILNKGINQICDQCKLTPDELLKIVDPYQSYLALHIWRHKD
jgi:DNA-3-methyladenine glycosylase II|tara:strand:+ start:333 stop:935 length:603 start_codon:yes stop_codon:yes gene_type:complete